MSEENKVVGNPEKCFLQGAMIVAGIRAYYNQSPGTAIPIRMIKMVHAMFLVLSSPPTP
jgi:hypothetical protein